MKTKSFPDIIQGGMGVGVSLWPLARAVSLLGGIGVISGTLVEVVVARTLQMGDPCGYIRWALAHFPVKEVADRVITEYYIPEGKASDVRFKDVPLFGMRPEKSLTDLVICASFAEVFLAKEGHHGLVGINLLEKVQLPTTCALYGAMLAGVDCVFVGAGIPKQVPRVLDNLSRHDYAAYKIDVAGAVVGDDFRQCFDPKAFLNGRKLPRLRRPGFLPIVSSPSIIKRFFIDEPEMIQGFVVELPPAGGHNAPPRGEKRFNARDEPVYGERDAIDWEGCNALGFPFWVGGGYAFPEKLAEALFRGAQGIQVGSIFALCKESGMDETLKTIAREMAFRRELDIFTDPRASSSGFPFKVANLPCTLAFASVYNSRSRICDTGRLQTPYRKADGSVGFRCPAENVAAFVAKGGSEEETRGRRCLCNGLLATAGFPQRQPSGYLEPPIVTLGSDVSFVSAFMEKDDDLYTTEDVMKYLRGNMR
ncbi:MAG: nitronate monooxygenase [Patescibacteria group bacterium]